MPESARSLGLVLGVLLAAASAVTAAVAAPRPASNRLVVTAAVAFTASMVLIDTHLPA